MINNDCDIPILLYLSIHHNPTYQMPYTFTFNNQSIPNAHQYISSLSIIKKKKALKKISLLDHEANWLYQTNLVRDHKKHTFLSCSLTAKNTSKSRLQYIVFAMKSRGRIGYGWIGSSRRIGSRQSYSWKSPGSFQALSAVGWLSSTIVEQIFRVAF